MSNQSSDGYSEQFSLARSRFQTRNESIRNTKPTNTAEGTFPTGMGIIEEANYKRSAMIPDLRDRDEQDEENPSSRQLFKFRDSLSMDEDDSD